MGDFIIRDTLGNSRSYQGYWEPSGVTDYDAILTTHAGARFATVSIPLSTTGFFLDGSGTPTHYDDLPEDFGIESLTLLSYGVTGTPIQLPFENVIGQTNVIDAEHHWVLSPTGIYASTILGTSRLTFGDPYLMTNYPFVPTKWNGLLRIYASQLSLQIKFITSGLGSGCRFPNVDFQNFGIVGVYNSYPPPPDVVMPFSGGIDIGGTFESQFLVDASGIYTLVPDQFTDELYQRSGGTHTILSTAIPDPFAKTAFFGQ